MSSPSDASLTDRLSPSLNRTSISESSSAYPHQNLPRRTHSDRSQQRSSHHYGRDNDLPPLPTPEMSAEARRQSIMAMDRKRRLTTSSQETGRRRTTTGGFTSRDNRFYQTPARQNSQSSGSPTRTSAFTEIIDLTGSSPPTARPVALPRASRTSSTGSRGYIIPPWQPDADVTECPICKRQFTFLFRRHHCRKCGRVVCNECSPHRITIPRQYIVHPPGEEEHAISSNANIVDLTRDEDDNVMGASPLRGNPALGGGEKVRLCNPCVPDPQPDLQSIFGEPMSRPLPPAPPANSSLFPSQASVSGFTRYAPQSLPQPRSFSSRDQPLPQLPHPGTRVHIESDEEDDELGSSLEAYHSQAGRRQFSPPSQSRYQPNSHSHSRYHSLDASRPPSMPPFPFNNHPRMLSMLEASRRQHNLYGPPPFQTLPSLTNNLPSSSSSAPRPPRPRIREEDICPICRGILPPKGPNNDETARENHIMECISQHDTSASATPPHLLQQRTRSNTQTHTQFTSTSSTIGNPTPGHQPPISSSLPTSPPPRAMPMQMVRFIATEKDCGVKSENDNVGEEGRGAGDIQPQECSICMVEYEVGERLARLECWCKFHEECIVEWFGRKRECPVHKLS